MVLLNLAQVVLWRCSRGRLKKEAKEAEKKGKRANHIEEISVDSGSFTGGGSNSVAIQPKKTEEENISTLFVSELNPKQMFSPVGIPKRNVPRDTL